MAARKSFLLRIDPQVLEAVRRWADEDLRSVNGQVEFLLRRASSDANTGSQFFAICTALLPGPFR